MRDWRETREEGILGAGGNVEYWRNYSPWNKEEGEQAGGNEGAGNEGMRE